MKVLNTRKNKMLGQGMTEYIIIVALIAIAAIGVFSMFGDVVKNQTAAMAKELGGNNGQQASDLARTQGNAAETKAKTKNSLQNFTGQQQ